MEHSSHSLACVALLAHNHLQLSYAVLQFPAGTTNPPHTHPRSAEDSSTQPTSSSPRLYRLGSASAGTVSLPTTSIDDNILAKAFKTDVATIQALNAGLAPKP
ncbi:hypothetical protein NC651_011641 [Populus alba x Populus x berolinensis]|nr:hypothetical protein NC651_011641 [Populus alba x Populus x berolinensis]